MLGAQLRFLYTKTESTTGTLHNVIEVVYNHKPLQETTESLTTNTYTRLKIITAIIPKRTGNDIMHAGMR